MSDAFPTVPNRDSRKMQPLPYRVYHEDKCSSLISINNKQIAVFWGNTERHPKNFEWCTEEQRINHIAYASHAMNYLPLVQDELERIYSMEDMPEEAIKAIETLMKTIYYEGVPKYAGK